MIKTILGKKGFGKTTLANYLIKGRSFSRCLIIDLFDQFPEYRLITINELIDILERGEYPLIPLRIAIFEADDFNRVCQILGRVERFTFVIDEIDNFDIPKSPIKSFRDIIHYGRHVKIDLITTSRRPANISRDLTSQTDVFYIFGMHEKRDLEYLRNLSEELAISVHGLQKFYYAEFDTVSFSINKITP